MKHFAPRLKILAPRSKFYKGPFGRIFPEIGPWNHGARSEAELDDHLRALAEEMREVEERFSNIPVGYTYFGQFVDHDITFDPSSSLMRQNDPHGILNHRTPRLDLDSVYGGGPSASPHLYRKDSPRGQEKFLLGKAIDNEDLDDLSRNTEGTALIGDPRNDENVIVSQMHLAFLKAHNTLVQEAIDQELENPFGRARTTLTWLYQHILWHDFVRRISDIDIHNCALGLVERCGGTSAWRSGLEDIYQWKYEPFIPIEFSVAAYRFGHTMVRESYQTNNCRGFREFVKIFSDSEEDLRGSKRITEANYIQWDWFLQMESSGEPFPQLSGALDTKISPGLFVLPGRPVPNPVPLDRILPFRNLKRGVRFDLPSGKTVARRLGLTPIEDIPDSKDALWFYILSEADGNKLGPVGSVIVCATFAGLLLGDPSSYLSRNPLWQPGNDPLLVGHGYNRDIQGAEAAEDPDHLSWSLGSIIRIAGLPVSGDDLKCVNPVV